MKKVLAVFAFCAIGAMAADWTGTIIDEKCSTIKGMKGNAACAAKCLKISHLLYVLKPTVAPAASHQRGSARISALITNRQTSGQTTRSSDAVISTCPINRGVAANAYDQAHKACAARPPPSSRLMRTTTSTDNIAKTVAGTRSAHGPEDTWAARRPSSGVSGG